MLLIHNLAMTRACLRVTRYKSQGFTLVEIVVVILVSSILAIGIVGFIGDSVEGINSSANRNRLASSGRVAIDRLSVELHNSLPNSLRASSVGAGGDQCLEFIPVLASTLYLDPPFGSGGGLSFDIIRTEPSQIGVSDIYAVIYPSQQEKLYEGDNGSEATWPNFATNRGPIQVIASIANSTIYPDDADKVTLTTTHRFRGSSPAKRFYIVDQPVSYCIRGDKLYRYSDYGFFANQTLDEEGENSCAASSDDGCLANYSEAPNKMLIADSIDNTGLTAFDVGNQTLRRNSLVAIEFNFSAAGDSVVLNHDVLTRGVL